VRFPPNHPDVTSGRRRVEASCVVGYGEECARKQGDLAVLKAAHGVKHPSVLAAAREASRACQSKRP